MKKAIFLSIILISSVLASADALDLTPHPVAGTVGNLRVNRYFFDDAGKQMAFRIDNNMTVKGTSTSASFKFTDLRNADMQIVKSARSPEVSFVEKELEVYRANARALIPANATDVQVDKEITNAIPINGWTSYQFTFSYKLFGFAYRRSVTFLNYSKTEQLVVDLSAPAPEFDIVSIRGYQVINSLSEFRKETSTTT